MMYRVMYRALLMLVALCCASTGRAEDAAQKATMTAAQFEASLKFQQGEITLPNGIAVLNVPKHFRYLRPADAQRVLEQAWGNPSGEGTQGMLFPAQVSPLAQDAWGVVITYEEDGHVSDADADAIDYDELLKTMQASSEEANAERVKQGYASMQLVGWAAKPYYDKSSKKLYWAKELKVGSAQEHTLNYNVRVLGRKGVLVLNAVSGMTQLPTIKQGMQDVVAFSNFTSGNAYADFDSKTDKTAAYGLAALVAGGIAAKAGLWAKLLALLIAGKKFIIIGAVLLFGGIGKLLIRKRAQTSEASQPGKE